MMEWTLVTGAAKGLGSAICLELASKKYSLVIHYRNSEQEAKQLQAECQKLGARAEIIQGDFSTTISRDQFLKHYTSRFSNTMNLVNNVGNYHVGLGLETSNEVWKELYEINFFTPMQMIQTLIPAICKAKGCIINIGVAGIQTVPSDIYSPAYTSTKLALWMMTKSLAKELIGKGVRVNMVSPGYLESSVDLPTTLPQGKTVSLKEAATLVAFLLDSSNSSISGQNIEIAGGVRL